MRLPAPALPHANPHAASRAPFIHNPQSACARLWTSAGQGRQPLGGQGNFRAAYFLGSAPTTSSKPDKITASALHARLNMTDAIQLDALELETRPDPDATVIWLHGLGAHGSDFIDAVPELGLPASAALRFVFPHAPVIPGTCNGGYRMRAWYDILALDASGRRLDADMTVPAVQDMALYEATQKVFGASLNAQPAPRYAARA